MSRSFETGAAPHFPAPTSVASMMRQVLLALLPGIATWVYFFGPGVLVQIGLAVGFALLFEALMLRLRGKSVGLFLGDWSAVLTAVLLALCIPPLAPWWIAATALLAARAGISMMATGGIGGVHRGAPFDVSTDLDQLSRCRVGLVCAGAKSVLDAAALTYVAAAVASVLTLLYWAYRLGLFGGRRD